MLETLRKRNDFPIYSVHDAAFAPYGRVVTDVDAGALIAAWSREMPESGVNYEPSIAELEACAGFAAMQRYFGSPMQAGCCWGYNQNMDALEYHRASEFNVAVTDMVLFLADRRDLDDNDCLDASAVKAFFAPKGTTIEAYATTLHYAPCQTDAGGFVCLVLLPKGTNHDLTFTPSKTGEERLLRARDKWLVCCDDCQDLIAQGAYPGVRGNLHLNL